MIKIKLTVQA